MRIAVTGGSGKGGAWVVRDLLDQGHDVLNIDIRPGAPMSGESLVADLTDLGQAHGRTRRRRCGRALRRDPGTRPAPGG